jgi:xanthine dehydrogenase accessory factor
VAQELVPLLIKLNCHVTCIDERKEWLDKITPSTNLTKILSNDLKATVCDFSKKCFFVLMTQGHSTDLPILSEILNSYDAAYIGVIGSKTKSVSLKSHLKQMGHNENKINSFYSPIGLDIGNNTPIEIAYSIVAQLLQKRDAFN